MWFSSSGTTLLIASGRSIEQRVALTGDLVGEIALQGTVKFGHGDLAVVAEESFRAPEYIKGYRCRVVSAVTGMTLGVMNEPATGWPSSVAMTPDGSYVVAVSQSRRGTPSHLLRWSVSTGEMQVVERPLKANSWAIGVDADGHFALLNGDNGLITYWDIERGSVEDLNTGSGNVEAIVGLTKGRALTVSTNGTVAVWGLARKELLCSAPIDSNLRAVSTTVNGSAIMTGDTGGNVQSLVLLPLDKPPLFDTSSAAQPARDNEPRSWTAVFRRLFGSFEAE
jgi:hypothetical protein